MDDFSLLSLQFEWGADEALNLEPVDRLAQVETRGEVQPRPAPRLAEAPKRSPAEGALSAALGAATVDELRAAVAAFEGCALRDTATNTVFAEGQPDAGILIVGDGPGRDEDRSGHAFAGAEGQLLDAMLVSIGLTRDGMMLTPLLPWRPPGGRPAAPAEIAVCLPFLHRLIALVKPNQLLLFGPNAAKAILPAGATTRRAQRGWIEVPIPGTSTPTPALCLPALSEMVKTPASRKEAWAGLRLLRRRLDSTP